jgi:hypothetical protein
MPELSIRHFVAVDDGGLRKYVGAGLGVRNCSFHAGSLGIFFAAGESETAFGYVLAGNNHFHPGESNAGRRFHSCPPVLAAFLHGGFAYFWIQLLPRQISRLFLRRFTTGFFPYHGGIASTAGTGQFSCGFKNFQFNIRKRKSAYGMATAACELDRSRRFGGRELDAPWIG